MNKKTKLLEQLAELEHEQWIYWSKSIANKLETWNNNLEPEETYIRYCIYLQLKGWKEQWIPYSKLSEEQKEKDRVWARKVLDKLGVMTI